MIKRIFLWQLATFILATVSQVEAQQAGKIPRIGLLLSGSAPSTSLNVDAFRQGLHDLGYVEEKSIALEYRYGEGKSGRLPGLAGELLRMQVAVIVTGGTAALQAAKQATEAVPIVIGNAGDPVKTGIVASLARPGGNITGLTSISPDLSGKRLELIKEIVPKASRVAVLYHPSQWDDDELKQTEAAAKALGMMVQPLSVRDPKEFQTAFASMVSDRANALIIIEGTFTGLNGKQIVELAATRRLPSMCDGPAWTNNGCLVSYGP